MITTKEETTSKTGGQSNGITNLELIKNLSKSLHTVAKGGDLYERQRPIVGQTKNQ